MVKPRELKADEVEFEDLVEEEEISIEDFFETADDEESNRRTREDLLRRAHEGDNSAWCCLVVKAKWKGHVGIGVTGCFVFPEGNTGIENQEFASDEFEQLREEALADLNREIQKTWETLSELL